jgi:hypothetical protein
VTPLVCFSFRITDNINQFQDNAAMSFVILRDPPRRPRFGGPILLALVGLSLAVTFLLREPRSLAPGLIGLQLLIIGAVVVLRRIDDMNKGRVAHRAFLERASNAAALASSTGELPSLQAPVNLQKGEICHWIGRARWYELRKQTRRVCYSGLTVSIPIMKHVRYRVGTIAPTITSSESLALIDTGTLYITNKRVFFDGASRNVTLKHNQLASVQVFLGGLNLERQAGRTPTLLLDGSAELAAAYIARGFTPAGSV